MPTTFSYAQAAKGASETPAPAKPVSTAPEKVESKPVEETSNVPESTTVTSETETSQEADKATPAAVEQDDDFTTVTSKARSKATHSRTSSPSVRSNTTQAKETDSSNTATNGSQDSSSEKPKKADSKADSKAEKSENGAEETKEKSGKSEKAEKEKNAQPKELKAAPLPTVNIWQQRKEAQEAKAKTSPTPTSDKPASGKADDTQQQDSSKVSPKKKSADGGQEGGKSGKKSEGGKGRDGVVPPPVEDASSWPTPQVAIGEDKKKAQEKSDKTDKAEKSPVNRSHGKDKWKVVDIVPSAVFNTPIPTGGNRGGRKPARGGRGGGPSHAVSAAAGDKVASGQANNNSSGAAGKQVSGDRGRNDANTNRAASLPAQPRRSNSADLNNAEGGNKAQATERNSNSNSRGPRTEETAASNGKPNNGGEAGNTRPPRDGKQFNARHGKGGHLSVDPQAAVRNNDRRFESGSKSADYNREAGAHGFQDFNRERGDHRGGRPNRGRGGAYSGFANQNGQFNNFGNHFTPKNLGYNDRQRAQHGLGNGQQGNRMPMRSPSLPSSAGGYPAVYPFAAEMNTVYSPYQTVAPAPMTVPYTQYIEPYGIISMLSAQLDYYFSIDNMCKDMFLRRHMDSQGFVPLNVIANFQRIKSLTEDFELVRHVVRQLQKVEYRIGEDGVERVRPREKWDQWVLPYDQRHASAQHEGAAPAQPAKTDENTPTINQTDDSTNGSIHPASRQQFIPNGAAANNAPKGLSSTAPEFMPSALNEVANVGLPADDFQKANPELASPMLSVPVSNPDLAEGATVDSHKPAIGLDYDDPALVPSHLIQEPYPARSFHSFDDNSDKYHPRHFSGDRSQSRSSRRAYDSQKRDTHFTKKFTNNKDVPESSQNHDATSRAPPFEFLQSQTHTVFRSGVDYELCCQALIANFTNDLYNDFRRSALDDFLTRRLDDGIRALIKFYHHTITQTVPMPNNIISDLVNLCSDHPRPKNMMIDMIQGASRQRQIETHNYSRIRSAFDHFFGPGWRRGQSRTV